MRDSQVEPRPQENPSKAPSEEAGSGLAVVPTNLPRVVLCSSELAKRGLCELAENLSAVQKLPDMPVGLWGHAAISDEANERVLIVGGWQNASTWAFSLRDWRWQELCPAGCSEGLLYPAVALDTHRNRLISFGGWKERVRPAIDDLMVLSLQPGSSSQWQRITAKGRWPNARCGASLTVDADGKRAFLFGGDTGGETRRMELRADLWCLDLEALTWHLLRHGGEPWLTRRFHQAHSHAVRGRLVIFGGEAGRSRWHDDGGGGSVAVVASVVPGQRHWFAPKGHLRPGVAMGYVEEANAIVGVSGRVNMGSPASESPCVWRYDLGEFRTWRSPLQSGVEVGPVQDHATCYCRHRRSLFWAGGKPHRSMRASEGRTGAFLVNLDALKLGCPDNPESCSDRFGAMEWRSRKPERSVAARNGVDGPDRP